METVTVSTMMCFENDWNVNGNSPLSGGSQGYDHSKQEGQSEGEFQVELEGPSGHDEEEDIGPVVNPHLVTAYEKVKPVKRDILALSPTSTNYQWKQLPKRNRLEFYQGRAVTLDLIQPNLNRNDWLELRVKFADYSISDQPITNCPTKKHKGSTSVWPFTIHFGDGTLATPKKDSDGHYYVEVTDLDNATSIHFTSLCNGSEHGYAAREKLWKLEIRHVHPMEDKTWIQFITFQTMRVLRQLERKPAETVHDKEEDALREEILELKIKITKVKLRKMSRPVLEWTLRDLQSQFGGKRAKRN